MAQWKKIVYMHDMSKQTSNGCPFVQSVILGAEYVKFNSRLLKGCWVKIVCTTWIRPTPKLFKAMKFALQEYITFSCAIPGTERDWLPGIMALLHMQKEFVIVVSNWYTSNTLEIKEFPVRQTKRSLRLI